MIITVKFIDRLASREIFACGIESRANTEANRCKALHAAYKIARAAGVNVSDAHVAHRFS